MRYVVVAIACGDGSDDYGHRIWSQVFQSREAADRAAKFVEMTGRAIVIEDCEALPSATAADLIRPRD